MKHKSAVDLFDFRKKKAPAALWTTGAWSECGMEEYGIFIPNVKNQTSAGGYIFPMEMVFKGNTDPPTQLILDTLRFLNDFPKRYISVSYQAHKQL